MRNVEIIEHDINLVFNDSSNSSFIVIGGYRQYKTSTITYMYACSFQNYYSDIYVFIIIFYFLFFLMEKSEKYKQNKQNEYS